MKFRPFQFVLLAGFALAAGDFGFRTWNPAVTPEYMIEGVVRPFSLQADGEPKKHLYLRRTWRLTEPPEQAWLQFIGHDFVEVFVNGRRAGATPLVGNGRLGGVVVDVTPLLHEGENSVAVHAPQLTLGRPPQVAILGECRFADGKVKSLSDPDDWKAASVYDRRGPFWYETAFEDEHWAKPTQGEPVSWRAQVNVPPGAIKHPRSAKWITLPDAKSEAAVFSRTFDVDGPPRDGWLRVLSTGSQRVAVNGYLLTAEQENLGIHKPQVARELTFDVSPLLRRGRNVVSILAETLGEPPRVLADLEATAVNGSRTYVATDDQWRGAEGLAADWLQPDFSAIEWQPCNVETGYLGVVPRTMSRELIELKPPTAFWAARATVYAAWVFVSGMVAALGATLVGGLLNRMRPSDSELPAALPYAALVPSTVAAAIGSLMTWDLAWAGHDIYQPRWVLALWLLVAAQWLLLLAINGGRAAAATAVPASPRHGRSRARRVAIIAGGALIAGVALWLRLRDLRAEPIHHDEVTAYAFTETVFQTGFPGGQVHPDIPFGYAATNELCYYFNALAAFFFDDPLLVIRVPSLIFSMLTLALIAFMGWKWFDGYVGAVAGVLFALSPHLIALADFGRYLAQVQFFALLTMYLTYEAVRGTGPPRIGMMWGATLAFIGMYFSWEGAGMFGVGLALAVFFQRRRHLKSLLASPHLYAASTVLVVAVVAQNAHRIMQQTQRLWYGEGISSLTI
ncbi:MAG: glycosyltransferase family 39 protein, partial [Pirellulales bacterium]|nr:glycosyltransferase family 39 protein [Pirellulales bacterium]